MTHRFCTLGLLATISVPAAAQPMAESRFGFLGPGTPFDNPMYHQKYQTLKVRWDIVPGPERRGRKLPGLVQKLAQRIQFLGPELSVDGHPVVDGL